MIGEVAVDTFEPHVGSRFTLRATDGSQVDAELTRATAVSAAGPRPSAPREPFSLIFRTTSPGQLSQGTYHVTHRELGEMDVFMVPIGVTDGQGVTIQAIFS